MDVSVPLASTSDFVSRKGEAEGRKLSKHQLRKADAMQKKVLAPTLFSLTRVFLFEWSSEENFKVFLGLVFRISMYSFKMKNCSLLGSKIA